MKTFSTFCIPNVKLLIRLFNLLEQICFSKKIKNNKMIKTANDSQKIP